MKVESIAEFMQYFWPALAIFCVFFEWATALDRFYCILCCPNPEHKDQMHSLSATEF